jgi:hypothetical protein
VEFPARLSVVHINNFDAIGAVIPRDKNWGLCCHHLDIPFGLVGQIASEGEAGRTPSLMQSLWGLGCERGLFTRCQDPRHVGLCDKMNRKKKRDFWIPVANSQKSCSE